MDWVVVVIWFLGLGPVAAAVISGLFWTALVHPERIRSRVEFRLSALCIATSLLTSVLVPLGLVLVRESTGRPPERIPPGPTILSCAVPPLLAMLSILLGIDSVTARRALPVTKAEGG